MEQSLTNSHSVLYYMEYLAEEEIYLFKNDPSVFSVAPVSHFKRVLRTYQPHRYQVDL